MPAPTSQKSVGGLHPELVTLRLKMLDGEMARSDARDREIKEAERRGRLTRPYGPWDKW